MAVHGFGGPATGYSVTLELPRVSRRRRSKKHRRSNVSRFVHAKGDKGEIGVRKLELDRIRQVFNVRSDAFALSSPTISFVFRPSRA